MNEIKSLVKDFADNVVAQSAALEKNGNHIKGNMHAKRYIDAFAQLRKYGAEGREALKDLFVHENADVRVTAAAYLLRYCEEGAKAVLEKEAAGSGLAGFSAEMTLKNWRNGNWSLDLEDQPDSP